MFNKNSINIKEKSDKSSNGYYLSLVSNLYSIPYVMSFILQLVLAFIEHSVQGIKYETGSDWAIMFLIVLFGPFQIISLYLSHKAISKYEECDKQNMSFTRKYMHILNKINLMSLFIIIIFWILIGVI